MTTTTSTDGRVRIPRHPTADHTRDMAGERRRFVEERTGASLEHVSAYSFDPAALPGNVENFVGVAQVPPGWRVRRASTARRCRATCSCRWPRPRATRRAARPDGCRRGRHVQGPPDLQRGLVPRRQRQQRRAHYANGLTALFIATGQDVANVSESHAGVTYTQLLPGGDYYWSVTLTSLIIATYGGGTGLPTQRECLELMGCYGKGRARRFAEICAAVVLAGETSLSSAIIAGDWVRSHDDLGQNRP